MSSSRVSSLSAWSIKVELDVKMTDDSVVRCVHRDVDLRIIEASISNPLKAKVDGDHTPGPSRKRGKPFLNQAKVAKEVTNSILRIIKNALLKAGLASSIDHIDRARVPILKFRLAIGEYLYHTSQPCLAEKQT